MPRIPTYQQQVGAPDIRMDIGQFGEAGRGLQRAGMAIAETGFDVANRFKEAERAQKLMAGQARMTRDLADLEIEFQNDTDWQTMRTRYQERTRGLLDRYRETFGGDQAVFGALSRDFQRSTIRGEIEVSKIARTRQVEAGKADLETALDTYSQMLAETADPLKTAEIEGRARAGISGAVAAGLIGADDGQRRERQFYDRIAQTRAIALIRDNPAEAFKRLSDAADPAFQRMDPKTREGLLTQANTRAEAAANRQAVERERAESQARQRLEREGNEILKTIEGRLDRGEEVTPEEIRRLERHGGISPSELRVIRRGARGEATQTDNATYLDLTRRSVTDAPAEFEAAAARAVETGKLSRQDYSTLVSRNRTDSRTDGPPRPGKAARDLVSQTLDPGAIFQGSAAAIGRTAQAQAIVEIDNWLDANPRSSRAEALAEAQAVVKRYQVIQFQSMGLALGVPQFINGGREAITPQTLDAAEREVIRRLDAKAMTQAQADQELRKIEGWRVIRSTPPAPPAPPQRGR